MLGTGLSGFIAHKQANGLPWNNHSKQWSKMKPSHQNGCSSRSYAGWRFPRLIAKAIVDYDYSKNCNWLYSTICL